MSLSPVEARGLAHLCSILEWSVLAEHCETDSLVMDARYALAKLRFALSDAGYSAMPVPSGTDSHQLVDDR